MSEQIICGADMGEGRKCNVQLGHPGGHIFINPVVTIDDAGNGINVYAELQQLLAKFAASEQQCASLIASEAHAREQWAKAVEERDALRIEAQWTAITEGAMPQLGDEVGGYDPSEAIPCWRVRAVSAGLASRYNARPQDNDWQRLGYTHFRAITPPALATPAPEKQP